MRVDPSASSPSPQEATPRLSHQLITALRRTPGFRRGSSGAAAPWATLWLLGTTAGIATPLVIHTISTSRPQAPGTSGPGTVAARTEGSRMDLRQAGPFRAAAPKATLPGRSQPSARDQALVAAFSSLPSPFTGGPLPAGSRGASPSAAGGTPEQGSTPVSPDSRSTGATRLGGDLSLADRLEGPLNTFARPLERDPRLQADTPDPLARRWSEHLQALVQRTPLVLPVEVVRIRSQAVDRPQAIPMALWPDGSATTNVAPPGEAGQRVAQDWVREQPALVEGSVRPVVMVIEPEAARPVVTTTSAPSRELPPPAPKPAWEPSAAAPEAPMPAADAPAAAKPSPVASAPEAAPEPAPVAAP